MKRYLLDVVIEKDKDGYFAYCPLIQGCYTQGATYEEALENIKDAIKLHLEDIEASKGTLSSPESISVTTLEIAA
jgi:predicted RNase H-like HicB family nuclease